MPKVTLTAKGEGFGPTGSFWEASEEAAPMLAEFLLDRVSKAGKRGKAKGAPVTVTIDVDGVTVGEVATSRGQYQKGEMWVGLALKLQARKWAKQANKKRDDDDEDGDE